MIKDYREAKQKSPHKVVVCMQNVVVGVGNVVDV